jgi:hypothetical protein
LSVFKLTAGSKHTPDDDEEGGDDEDKSNCNNEALGRQPKKTKPEK